jgi:hypothetical protein
VLGEKTLVALQESSGGLRGSLMEGQVARIGGEIGKANLVYICTHIFKMACGFRELPQAMIEASFAKLPLVVLF